MTKNTVNTEGAFTSDIRKIINHNFSDVSLATAQLDIVSSTAFTNVPGMVTDTLAANSTYKFRIVIPTVCTANNGSKFAFKQSVSGLINSIEYDCKAFTASAVAVSRGTTVTDQTAMVSNASAVVILAEITGVLVTGPNPGTLQVQAAQATSHSDTLSVFKNAQLQLEHIAVG